ncbi:MAG: hypothetical protein F6K10_22175 [Moorea sp. SIO2B7]|nr:hypothetical protein [Moorena sp. SIO2B7]
MIILVDYNLTGYIVLFQGTLVAGGWLDLLPIRFITLKEAGLDADTSDRVIWKFAQSHQLPFTLNC